jgi:hypothetical protein
VVKHGSTLILKTPEYGTRAFHQTPLHSLKVAVLRAAVSRRRIFGPVFPFTETVTAGRFKELSVNFISFWKLMNKTAGLSKKGLRHIQQSEHCVRCVSYWVVALFTETCGPLDPRVYRRRISIVHLSFLSRTCTRTTHKCEKNRNKISICAFQTSLQQKLVHRVASDTGKGVNSSVNAVGICST